jgi:Transposase DDE domain
MHKNSKTRRKRQRKHRRRQAAFKDGLLNLFTWFLPDDSIFATLKLHGNCKWVPRTLVFLTMVWSFSDARNLTDAFDEALEITQKLLGPYGLLTTYQGFMNALVGWSASLLPPLQALLRQRMEQVGGPFWRLDGWVPLAFDGSRSTTPRTVKNEAAFCAPNYGKSAKARSKQRRKKAQGLRKPPSNPQPQEPQTWITMMWHMGLRLAWDWRLGPSNASEREHVMNMVQERKYPRQTLFCGDAGFIGYPLWSALLKRGDFLVRVGANVHLLTEQADWQYTQEDEKGSVVWCWPKAAIRDEMPPLQLRLVRIRLGKEKMWMLTSVLESDRLTNQQIVRFYKLRWGVEVEFRGLKQTLDRAKLRSRNDARLLVELDWSILAMALGQLFAIKEQVKAKTEKYDPTKRSLAKILRAIRYCLRHLDARPVPGKDLGTQLAEAQTDGYERKRPKKARYRPKNKDKKPLGDPQIRLFDAEEQAELPRWRTAEKIAA